MTYKAIKTFFVLFKGQKNYKLKKLKILLKNEKIKSNVALFYKENLFSDKFI